MKTNFTISGVFVKINALKMSVASFIFKNFVGSAYESFITKIGNTVKYQEIQ
jgi:hypothetical protein